MGPKIESLSNQCTKSRFIGDQLEPIRRECLELMAYAEADAEARQAIREWTVPRFPVGGLDLMPAKVPRGPTMKLEFCGHGDFEQS